MVLIAKRHKRRECLMRASGLFQLTEVPSITTHLRPLAESPRLLLRCIPMPSIFRASPLPSARARSRDPQALCSCLGVLLFLARLALRCGAWPWC